MILILLLIRLVTGLGDEVPVCVRLESHAVHLLPRAGYTLLRDFLGWVLFISILSDFIPSVIVSFQVRQLPAGWRVW